MKWKLSSSCHNELTELIQQRSVTNYEVECSDNLEGRNNVLHTLLFSLQYEKSKYFHNY
jgi:hypothetical protein